MSQLSIWLIIMAQTQYFNESSKSIVTLLGYLFILPLLVSLVLNWTGYSAYSPLWMFRLFSLALLTLMSGFILGIACVIKPQDESFSFQLNGVVWGCLLVIVTGVGVVFIVPKAGVFIAGLLFLVLWQVELKSNLSRLYPEWFWVLRTKLSMAIAMSHILLWLTLA